MGFTIVAKKIGIGLVAFDPRELHLREALDHQGIDHAHRPFGLVKPKRETRMVDPGRFHHVVAVLRGLFKQGREARLRVLELSMAKTPFGPASHAASNDALATSIPTIIPYLPFSNGDDDEY